MKPEFWEDETIASISRDARLLFIACLNLADDEGLLRWTPEYLKSGAFMYDDDVQLERVSALMAELKKSGMVFPYKSKNGAKFGPIQKLAVIVNFHKHQRINRPTPSKLTPPQLQELEVKYMYAERDDWTCYLCGCLIEHQPFIDGRHQKDLTLSLDHVFPVCKGGTDYPSNIRSTHRTCNIGKGDRVPEHYQNLVANKATWGQQQYGSHLRKPTELVTEPVNESLSEPSRPEVEVEVELGSGKGKEVEVPKATPDEKVQFKTKHTPLEATVRPEDIPECVLRRNARDKESARQEAERRGLA